MLRSYSRLIAAIVVCFFTWTSGGVFSIAHAAVDAAKKAKAAAPAQKPEGTEEKFAKLTEELRQTLADGKLSQAAKRERLLTARSELMTHDIAIRAEFAATEQKLKAAKLPAEILERHYAFVKHYDNNLKELQGNIERVEKAKDEAGVKVEVEKTLAHLEKTKAPSRHQKLDPNNLPHRQPKAIKREPRMKKEEFEKDLKKDKHAWKSAKRVHVAATGSLAGLLPPDDLAETVEVQFTPEIRAKALELGNSPVKIYEWVRNNVEYVPTWGSIQGAQMTLLTKQGNAFDTASLLIALLRAAGIHARYVTGTVELPIDKVMNWAGGFSDPQAALNFIASGGIPVTGIRSGGKVVTVRMEHVWVKAYVDYVPSLGAVHKEGDTWIPLDASFKRYNYTDGVDFKTLVPFDGQAFADQLKATATINEQESYVTNVNSAMVQTALTDYNDRVGSYAIQNLPDATAADILGKKEIVRKDQAILPSSLPYKVVVAGTETSEVADQNRHKIDLNVADANTNDSVFSYSASLPQLAGKRISVNFEPATPADKSIIDNYVAQYAASIPAYLIQLKPVLRIENSIIATGPAIGMGAAQKLSISITSPRGMEIVTHNLAAGDYTAIGLNPSKISLDVLQNRIDKNDFAEPVAEMLHQTALSYWAEVDAFNNVIAKTLKVRNLRHTSELAATAKVSISSLFGVPTAATYKSRNIDVKIDNQSVMGKSIDSVKDFAYMQQSGANSSFLEGAIFDQLFGKNIGDSISAVSAIKLANDQGIPIYGIHTGNLEAVLPKLQVSEEVKAELANAVNAGLRVQIPKTNIMQLGWTGVGYIISNPVDGTAAYRISGGLNGGDSPTAGAMVLPLPQVPLTGPIAFIIGGLLANSDGITIGGCNASTSTLRAQSITASNTQCIIAKPMILAASSATLEGAVPVAVAPELIAAGVYLSYMAVILMIWAALKSIADRFNPPPRWESYRHYTSVFYLMLILNTNTLKVGPSEGTYGYGIYLTRIYIQPDSTINASGQISYGPNCERILNELELQNYGGLEKTEAYLDLLIDTSKRGVMSKKPPQEYLLVGWPEEIIQLGLDIKIAGSWMPKP